MKKYIQQTLLLLAILMPFTASAYDFSYRGIFYNKHGNEVAVTYKEFPYYNGHGVYTGDVTIPDTVLYYYPVVGIESAAFYGCNELTSITLPNTIRFIGDFAFYNCTGLTSITLPNSIKTIIGFAFYNCTALSSITFSNAVTSLGEKAFHNTAWYSNQPDGLVYTGSVIYEYKGTMPAGTSITIAEGTLAVGDAAFSGCSGLIGITFPNSLVAIGNVAFDDCSGLTSLEIPNSVTTIGNHAFQNCSSLTSVDIGNSVTTIKEQAFYKCDGLKRVNITDLASWCNIYFAFDEDDYFTSNPLFYAHHLFLNGEEVKDLVIPDCITEISKAAFYKCHGLTSVTIPNSINSIGYRAFYDCDSLQTVICLGSMPPVMASSECFSTTAYNRAKLLVPRQSIETYKATNYWNKFVNIEGYGDAAPGDVNGDGVMKVDDVTTLIDALLSGNVDAIFIEAADLNANGRLDIDDVTSLIDMLLES